LLADVSGGMIITMGHQRTPPSIPDLFSTALVPNSAPPQVSSNKDSVTVSQQHVLPQDLPNAVKHLTDTELDLLITAAVDEAKRRGRLPPKVEPKQRDAERASKDNRRVELATRSLTRAQISAVQAAYKAGITPSRIARQFGISQSDVRKALTADTTTKRVR
jgi:DNA-binding CsgD family transcriptional regulator